MKPAPIPPAHFAFNERGQPWAPGFDDVYHPEAGAFGQALHVFLGGNGLPGRWAGRQRFVILEAGFGLGNNFLATWAAWRADPARCERLVFIAIDKHPLRPDDMARAHTQSPEPALAAQLLAQWPLLTPNLHALDFEDGQVQLILAFGDVQALLPELQAEVDAVYLDGFARDRNPDMWAPDVFTRLTRLLAPCATAATWNSDPALRHHLASIGFDVQAAPGFAGQHEMTVGRWAPRFVPPRPVAFRAPPTGPRQALIIGGGLAGCAAAWALSRQGWASTVVDRQPHPAMETSGNPGGLMHGIFNAPDSLHSRWFRAAALHTARWAGAAVQAGRVAGRLDGLLRLDPSLASAEGLAQAQAQWAAVGLPADYLHLLSPAQASAASGCALPAAWRYGAAGWLSPRDYCAELLAQAGAAVTWLGGQAVAELKCTGPLWQAVDAHGTVLAQAPVLVLAHALGARSLWPRDLPALPLAAVRGQTTLWADHRVTTQPNPPALPLSGLGYALSLGPEQHNALMLGASSQPEDMDPALRLADHRYNLARAVQLGVLPPQVLDLPDAQVADLPGRVGWRAVAPDRLPLVGPPVDASALAQARALHHRLDALRHLPRCHSSEQGVYVLSGLASRGITSAALAARLLAAWVSGAPQPVENSLRDALDPARFNPPR